MIKPNLPQLLLPSILAQIVFHKDTFTKVASKTKMVYFDNGDKKKDKANDDFNISALRYGFTARIGFRSLKLFANYYPMALFEDGNGPVGGDNLYPFSVGLSLANF